MKMIPADRGMVASLEEGTGTLSWEDVHLRSERALPVPRPFYRQPIAVPGLKPVVRPAEVRKPSVWIPLSSEFCVENWMLLLLVVAATFAIAYGFFCLTDLVQNWAAVNFGIDKLIR